MENEQLPAGLKRLERALLSCPGLEPSAALRDRVLFGMRDELRRDRALWWWRFTAAAAAVFLWVSLSATATKVIYAALAPRQPEESIVEVARRVQRLSPELSPEESLHKAILFQSAAALGSEMTLEDRLGVSSASENAMRGTGGRDGGMIRGLPRTEQPGGRSQSHVPKLGQNEYV